MVRQITPGFTIIPVLSSEATLQVIVFKGEANHLQGIILRPVNTDRILTEAQEAILFRQEAAWKEVVIPPALIQAVADLPHPIADLQDLLQVLLPPVVLHHVEAVVHLLEEDSLKQ
jgi:hypothetical protein